MQLRWRVETVIGDERSVLAVEIFDRRCFSSDPNQRMAPGDARGIEEQLEIGISSQHVFAFAETRAAVRPLEAKPDGGAVHGRAVPWGFGRGHLKRVAEPGDCAHEAWVHRIISEGLSNLGDEIHQVLLDHEGVWPEALLKGDLRECLGSIRDEDLQQLIRLRRERDRVTSPQQLPRVQIQNEVPEGHAAHFRPSTMNSSERRRT